MFQHTLMSRRHLLAGVAVASTPLAAHAQVGQGNQQPEITVDRARTTPIPIALPNFTGTQIGTDMTAVIANNLGRSGLFRPISQAAQISGGDGGMHPTSATGRLRVRRRS